jgi:hypothetical protein
MIVYESAKARGVNMQQPPEIRAEAERIHVKIGEIPQMDRVGEYDRLERLEFLDQSPTAGGASFGCQHRHLPQV